MFEYEVTIEETVSETFKVRLDRPDEEKAQNIAIENYKNGKFVLEPGNVTSRLMQVQASDGSYVSDWKEF